MSTPEERSELRIGGLHEREFLAAGAVVEVILAALALGIIWAANQQVLWNITLESTFAGVGGAALLFLFSLGVYGLADLSTAGWAAELKRFRDSVARPLSEILSFPNACALSVLAGMCEELFFRGALQPLAGTLLTAAAFSFLHFGPRIREWRSVPAVYFLVSLFFSGIYYYTQSLWAPVVTHALYDAIILFELRQKT